MLIMVWQHNPSFLGKRAILSIPLIGTVGFVNEMIAVDREVLVAGAAGAASDAGATTKDKIVAHILDPCAPPLLVFPEGTTCRNDCLLQFKAGGAFQTSHNAQPVQPMLLTFHNRIWLPWRDTFDYANTPATNSKLWALRFLCRFRHALTVTYLPPVDPHHLPTGEDEDDHAVSAANGAASSVTGRTTVASPVAFANATRDAMAAAMGPTAQVTEQSYEEFFLFKVGCEQLRLPGRALRSLDFKRARAAVSAASIRPKSGSRSGCGESTWSSDTEGSAPLTLEGAKATLRAYAACRQAQQASPPSSLAPPLLEGVTAVGLALALLNPRSNGGGGSSSSSGSGSGSDAAELAEASELWLALAAEAAAANAGGRVVLAGGLGSFNTSQPLGVGGLSAAAAGLAAAPDAALDFQAFLVGLHRKRPRAAVTAGWLSTFGNGNADPPPASCNPGGSSNGRTNSAALVLPEGAKRPRSRAAAAAQTAGKSRA